MEAKLRVLLAGTHAAAGQYIKALLPEMERRGHHAIVFLAGAAAEMLKGQINFVPAENASAQEILESVKPDHLCCCIAGVAAENPWESQLAQAARQKGIPWTGHEDMELTATLETYRSLWLEAAPAKIFTAEQTSLEGLTELGVPVEKITVAGNPTWDTLVDFDASAVRAKIRQRLQLRDNERLAVWLAPKTRARTEEEWQWILPTFNQLVKNGMRLSLVAYFHPGCPDWKNTAAVKLPHGLYQAAMDNANFRVLAGFVLKNESYDQNQALAASDLVVSFGSTLTLVTAMLGIPTVRPFTPGNLASVASQKRPQPHLFGPVATGCQIAVRSAVEWRNTCLNLLRPDQLLLDNLRTNCNIHYPLPQTGGYAARIVKEIEKLH